MDQLCDTSILESIEFYSNVCGGTLTIQHSRSPNMLAPARGARFPVTFEEAVSQEICYMEGHRRQMRVHSKWVKFDTADEADQRLFLQAGKIVPLTYKPVWYGLPGDINTPNTLRILLATDRGEDVIPLMVYFIEKGHSVDVVRSSEWLRPGVMVTHPHVVIFNMDDDVAANAELVKECGWCGVSGIILGLVKDADVGAAIVQAGAYAALMKPLDVSALDLLMQTIPWSGVCGY